jgi:hypothetical protein
MKNSPGRPIVEQVWIVVQENEGLIMEAFPTRKAAVASAKKLAKKCPSMRTEVANYLIAVNSWKSFGSSPDDTEDE